jgi:regulator of replication initiation timing
LRILNSQEQWRWRRKVKELERLVNWKKKTIESLVKDKEDLTQENEDLRIRLNIEISRNTSCSGKRGFENMIF